MQCAVRSVHYEVCSGYDVRPQAGMRYLTSILQTCHDILHSLHPRHKIAPTFVYTVIIMVPPGFRKDVEWTQHFFLLILMMFRVTTINPECQYNHKYIHIQFFLLKGNNGLA